MLKKIKRYLQNPYFALGNDMIRRCPHLMSDKFYLSVLWKMVMGYEIDWRHPKTFNEKLQWLKLHDHNPLYTTLVDKYRVKQWVADRIGDKYIIPTLEVFNSVDDVDLERLPDQFVLKCNHDSGSVFICKDKSKFNLEAVQDRIKLAFDTNFYWEGREWPYKNVRKCLFAEKYLEEERGAGSFGGLRDYKFFCFDGIPRIMYIANDRAESPTTDFFDMDFNHLPVLMKDPPSSLPIKMPDCFTEMKELAVILSKGLPHVRVDFYEHHKRVLFGEMTFYHNSGFSLVRPNQWNLKMGEWITLPSDR